MFRKKNFLYINRLVLPPIDPLLFKGTLLLIAVLYTMVGVLFAWIIKQFFWIPHRFRHGVLVAGGWGNTGDIRKDSLSASTFVLLTILSVATSVILSVTGSAPFRGSKDQDLAIAYMSVFVLVFMVRGQSPSAHQI